MSIVISVDKKLMQILDTINALYKGGDLFTRVLFEIDSNTFRVVATDGYTLFESHFQINSNDNIYAILYYDKFTELYNHVELGDKIKLCDTYVAVNSKRFMTGCTVFPNYRAILDMDYQYVDACQFTLSADDIETILPVDNDKLEYSKSNIAKVRKLYKLKSKTFDVKLYDYSDLGDKLYVFEYECDEITARFAFHINI